MHKNRRPPGDGRLVFNGLGGLLEVEFDAELELTSVKGSSRAAVIATVRSPEVKGFDVVDKR